MNMLGAPKYTVNKDHIHGMARSEALREDNMKKWSRHRVLARNEGWM
jgi:hypothetical protein